MIQQKEAKEAKGTIWEPIYKSSGKPCLTSREKNCKRPVGPI
jgi:hypothetical protein